MANKPPVIKGTIYLQGPQTYFHRSITQLLNLNSADHHLNYQISTDILETIKNKDITYRVDYTYYPGQPGIHLDTAKLTQPFTWVGGLEWFRSFCGFWLTEWR